MKYILFGFLLICSFSTNAVEIIIEENGNRRIIKIPDNQKQDVVLKINTTNSHKKNNNKKCILDEPVKKTPSKKAYMKQSLPVKKMQPKTIIVQNKQRPIIVKGNGNKQIQLVNVYHYFYPCSANPTMKDCVPDKDIKIDNKTDRMVIEDEKGLHPVDMIDRKSKIISEPNTLNRDLKLKNNLTENHGKITPIFDGKNYPPQSIPTHDEPVRINGQYDTKNITVIK